MRKQDDVGARIKQVRAGLKAGFPQGVKSLKVGDKTYTHAELDRVFADYDVQFDAVEATHKLLEQQVDARNGAKPGARGLLADFKTAMKHVLGRASPDLALYGINPERPRKRPARKTPPSASKPAA